MLNFPINPTTGDLYQTGSSATYEYNGSYWTVVTPTTDIRLTANSASYATTSVTASYAVSASYLEGGTTPTFFIGTQTSGSWNVSVGEGAIVWFLNVGSAISGRPQHSTAPIYYTRTATGVYYISNITSPRTTFTTSTGNIPTTVDPYGTIIYCNGTTGVISVSSGYVSSGDTLMIQKFKI